MVFVYIFIRFLPDLFGSSHFHQYSIEFDTFCVSKSAPACPIANKVWCSSSHLLNVRRLPGLTKEDNEHVAWILQRVEQQGVKPLWSRDSSTGPCTMEPIFVAKDVTKEGSGAQHDYFFFNIPYFSLEQYSPPKRRAQRHLSTATSLIQTRYPLASDHRELQQAVCQLLGSSSSCLHVSGLWCLVIRDGKPCIRGKSVHADQV